MLSTRSTLGTFPLTSYLAANCSAALSLTGGGEHVGAPNSLTRGRVGKSTSSTALGFGGVTTLEGVATRSLALTAAPGVGIGGGTMLGSAAAAAPGVSDHYKSH